MSAKGHISDVPHVHVFLKKDVLDRFFYEVQELEVMNGS